MSNKDKFAVQMLNPGKGVWWNLWGYPDKDSAYEEMDKWVGSLPGRELRVAAL